MQDDIFIFIYGREYIKVRSLKVRWRMLSHQYLHDKVLGDRYFITITLNMIDQDLLVL